MRCRAAGYKEPYNQQHKNQALFIELETASLESVAQLFT